MRRNNSMPPPLAIATIVISGFGELMTLLRSPFYLGVMYVGFKLGKVLSVKFDIVGKFRNGLIPGIISLLACSELAQQITG